MLRESMSRFRRVATCTLAAAAALAPAVSPAAAEWLILSFPGNTPEWNRKLGVSELRVPCTNPPANCMKRLRSLAEDEGVSRFTISMTRELREVAQYAAEFSELSRSHGELRGIGIDDFVGTLQDWRRTGDAKAAVRALEQAIANAKSANPALEFGITLYEDQLHSPLLGEQAFPRNLRAKVDRVSLFVHYRENGPAYRDYVRQARKLFPKADIIAGAYAYDRIDYLPCAKGGAKPCTAAQESGLFERAFAIQVDMLRKGAVDGIEFFPGRFGVEQDWSSWTKNPRNCKPDRLQDCLATTRRMRERALAILREARPVE
jgi:hypothetical protein